MTLPYERTRAIKRLLDFSDKLLMMNLAEIRKNARELRDENISIRRHLCSSGMFDHYYEESERC